ncbi:MAG TPA: cytochrome c-type biogenesis protein [Rhizomicrobium sp.]|nr:cytochrome c-type biogenesis protein [Rhizomicrobium sp.]
MIRALALAALLAAGALPGTGPEKLSDPAQEARAVALQKEFRCLVCQGESLDESNATLAGDLRRLIRARIEAGDSNEQIEHYLVSRYGEFILMKPPLEPDTYALWYGPLLVFLIGAGVAGTVIWRARGKTSE